METPESLVALNVRALRAARNHTVRSLSALLGKLGRPILPSGITKIEDQTRRVGVADLVALAVALGVTPNRLMLPSDPDEDVRLTPELPDVPAHTAWNWASGRAPLPIRGMSRANEGGPMFKGDDDLRQFIQKDAEEYDDFYRHAWPAGERLANEHTAARAARDVVNRLHEVIQGNADRTAALRRALTRLNAEVDDLIGDDDGR